MIRSIVTKPGDEQGIAIIVMAILMVMLIAFAALAIDIGHLFLVRAELQNAADAAALAGASFLYSPTPSSSTSAPNWATATAEANSAMAINKSEGEPVAGGSIQVGYWDLSSPPTAPLYALKSSGSTPGANDFASTQVTVSKTVKHYVSQIIGISTTQVSAKATATMSSPGTAYSGALAPFAISEAAANALGKYAPFEIADMEGVKLCTKNGISTMCGQWTTMLTDGSNSNAWIKDLIGGEEPSPERKIGDSINIVPGVRASDYKEATDHLLGKNILVPVVKSLDPSQPDIPDSPGGYRTIVGFMGFHIVSVNKHGSHSYISGYMLDDFYAKATGDIGPNYGAYAPPRLVQ